MNGSFQLQPASVANAATATARGKATVAKVFFGIATLFLLMFVGMLFDVKKYEKDNLIAGVIFWIVILGGVGAMFQRRASRLRAAGARATSDPSLQWYLNGFQIVAADARGIPQPDLSFKINGSVHAMLTAVPAARAMPFER